MRWFKKKKKADTLVGLFELGNCVMEENCLYKRPPTYNVVPVCKHCGKCYHCHSNLEEMYEHRRSLEVL